MKSLFKRVAVGALAAAMLLSTGLTAMARDEMTDMKFVDFHVELDNSADGIKVVEVYNEVRDGRYTGKQLYKEVAEDRLTWVFEGYEGVYPYAGYECLYIDGLKQAEVIKYDGTTPQWKTKRQDYSWTITEPYQIWERQMTQVNGTTWNWDFENKRFGIDDRAVFNPTVRYVEPVVEYEVIGTAVYDVEGDRIYTQDCNTLAFKPASEFEAYYDVFGDLYAVENWNKIALPGDLSWDSLSEKKESTNEYEITDAMIQSMVPVFKKKLVTAPGERTRDVLAEYKKHPEYPVWTQGYVDEITKEKYTAADTIIVEYDATISWTTPQYELAEPYREYQFLIVNGIVLDGSKDANGEYKDCVGRYTGALGNPVVEWEFYMYNALGDEEGDVNGRRHVYEVVERKLINGKKVVDAFGHYVTRVRTDVYGYGYVKSVAGGLEYRVAMEDGSNDRFLGYYDAHRGEVVSQSDDLVTYHHFEQYKDVVAGGIYGE